MFKYSILEIMENNMAELIIIGGGAAGMLAAAIAAREGIKVTLIEKNEKLGKKVYITGKGRCNMTNACDTSEFFQNIVTNSKFMFSSIYGFTPYDVIDYFNSIGLATKVERGNRVFPTSDHSSDVNKYLEQEIRKAGAKILFNKCVKEITLQDGRFESVTLDDGTKLSADYCFVATGGLSYPSTGSTGDGYRFAKEAGHKVTRLLPSLVSVKTNESWVSEVEGLSLKNVVLSAYSNGKCLYSDMGEMLFTRNGISGPLVLTLSSNLADTIASGNKVSLNIDLKPALNYDMLDARVLKDFEENINRQFANSLGKLLPQSIIPVIVRLSGIRPDKPVNSVTKEEREKLVHIIKELPLTVLRLGGYDEAVITKGGVDVKQVNPSTMESKLVKGLYFIGEVLDVDAYTGGFNLQIAWSTAHAAATSLLNS